MLWQTSHHVTGTQLLEGQRHRSPQDAPQFGFNDGGRVDR